MPSNAWSAFARAVRRWMRAPLTLSVLSIGRSLTTAGLGMAELGNRLVAWATSRLQAKARKSAR